MAADLGALSNRQPADVLSDAHLCAEILEEPLTAYLAGADDLEQYRRWLSGGDDDRRRISPRLAAARRVIMAFWIDNELAMARAWLRDLGSAGHDIPARVIRDKGDDEAVGVMLADAAGEWLTARRPRLS